LTVQVVWKSLIWRSSHTFSKRFHYVYSLRRKILSFIGGGTTCSYIRKTSRIRNNVSLSYRSGRVLIPSWRASHVALEISHDRHSLICPLFARVLGNRAGIVRSDLFRCRVTIRLFPGQVGTTHRNRYVLSTGFRVRLFRKTKSELLGFRPYDCTGGPLEFCRRGRKITIWRTRERRAWNYWILAVLIFNRVEKL